MANFNIDYLVVAGGGGGASASSGYSGGGAGGAGGYRTSYGTGNISGGNSPVEAALNLTIGTSYTITVGDGGAGGPAASPINAAPPSGSKGNDSVFASITSEGGGYGTGQGQGTGGSGGSGGGGGGYTPGSGGSGASSQGNSGGTGTTNCASNACYLGGGGGGASQAGSSVQDGKGGDGLSSSITGSSVIRAGGGSGGSYGPIGWNDPIAGGAGGGGAAGVSANGYVGQPGTANTGGGGGGATWYTNQVSRKGGDGGSGIIILRYATADANYTTAGLTPTETIDGTDTILSFTTVGTGSITFATPPPPPFSGIKVTTPVTDFNKTNTEEGLKIPSGTSSNQPTGVTGMLRNDTTQSSKGSSSAISYYNGTDWRYFENELSTSFNTVIYTGSTSPHAITGVGFQPDLIWVKNRDQGDNYAIVDSVRGIASSSAYIASNMTATQATSPNLPTSVQSDGFTITGNGSRTNVIGEDYVAWCFKAGGLINKAAYFNGSNSYTYASSSVQQPTTDFSVSVWSKWDSKPSGSVGLVGNFRTGGGGTQPGLAIAKFNGTNVFRFYTGQNDYVSGTTNFSTNTWYHVVGTYDGSNMKIYVNGVLEGTQPYTGTPLTTTEPLVIGRMYGNYSGYYHNGLINQVRLFNNAISALQVTELYEETAADNSVLNFPNGAGCVAAYNLGENANGVDGLYNTTASNVTFGKPGYLTRNTEGTIESTVSANNDLGFSIVSYTGNGTAGATVGHGLASTPEMVIVKSLTTTANQSWSVYHVDVGNSGSLPLEQAIPPYYNIGYWNNTSPTSSVFTLGNYEVGNKNNADYIAYCFASKSDYSKVGSYVGNGNASGPIITLGFEPAWVMIKGIDANCDWNILDNKRDTSNPNSARLDANSNNAEYSAVGLIDFNSDGFQIVTTQGCQNGLNKNFIYLAFANTI